MTIDIQAIVIGVSAGGFRALHEILPMFPENFKCPVMIVQHTKPSEDNFLVESLDRQCKIAVKEAEDKEQINSGTIYIAPGGYHLLVEKDKTLSLSVDEPVLYARPSIDVLFETAARAFGAHLAGIILTGANSDGSNGICAIKANRGFSIAQDPETSEFETMPNSAIATGCIDFILPLEGIPSFITGLLEDNHGTC